MDSPQEPSTQLSWLNVGLGFSFILFDAVLSFVFGLHVGGSLVTAAVRCVVQLAVVGTVLQRVLETDHPWAVAGITCLLNIMGTFEIVMNKSKLRFHHMFSSVLFAMLVSTIPVSIIGTRFAMSVEPFWSPMYYVPIVGMLCGNAISGIIVSVSYVLKELSEDRDKVEMYLAFGASRLEACKPIATEALRLALTPTINQMSVLGIIAIPGMMTGAILGGSSVEQAAKLQMIIMFMISASGALSAIITTVIALAMVVDGEHRVRSDRIDSRKHAIWRGRSWLIDKMAHSVSGIAQRGKRLINRGDDDRLLG